MDNLKLLRVQVAAKVAYLESMKAEQDALSTNREDTGRLLRENKVRLKAFREVLRDIDALGSL